MSRIKGGRASAMDVAAFTKKSKGKAPAKKAPPPMARRPMPMAAEPTDMSGVDDSMADVMPPPRKGRY